MDAMLKPKAAAQIDSDEEGEEEDNEAGIASGKSYLIRTILNSRYEMIYFVLGICFFLYARSCLVERSVLCNDNFRQFSFFLLR